MKKAYISPKAELVMLAPCEEVAAKWEWGQFKSATSSMQGTTVNVDSWSPWDFSQDDDSYKIID